MLALASSFILINNAIAKDLLPLKDNSRSFESVHWKITLADGGFALKNNTDKSEVVQVVHKKGSFGTFKVEKNMEPSCQADFEDHSHQLSMVCVLSPGEELEIVLDMASLKEAEGTYQISFEN